MLKVVARKRDCGRSPGLQAGNNSIKSKGLQAGDVLKHAVITQQRATPPEGSLKDLPYF